MAASKKKSSKKQAMRFNENKPKLSYLLDFPNAVAEFANVCEFGAEKYARHNWKQGMPITEMEDSLLRHMRAFHNCQDRDEETACEHLAHVMWNAAAMMEVLAKHGDSWDDRDWENA